MIEAILNPAPPYFTVKMFIVPDEILSTRAVAIEDGPPPIIETDFLVKN